MSIAKAVAGLVLLWCAGAQARDTANLEQRLELRGGLSAFLNSQSNVPSHRLKPTLRLEWIRRYQRPVSFGVELLAVVDKNENYRLVGGFLNSHLLLVGGNTFEWWLVTGWGVGTGPRILYTDLKTKNAATLWAHAGLEWRWWVNDYIAFGVDLVSENLSMVTLNVAAGFRL